MDDLLLLAASGLAREVIAASHSQWRVAGILDDDPTKHGTIISGVEVIGGVDLAAHRTESLIVCVGSGAGRRAIVGRLAALGVEDARYATMVDDTVRIPAGCSVGHGSVLLPGVVVTADAKVGRHVVIMPNVTVTHDNVLDDFVTIAAGASLGGSVKLGAGSYIGMNASIRQGLSVGSGATVGMGSAVLHDVPDGETWVGVPARALRGFRIDRPRAVGE